ncbi:unnamed protein product [Dicrocoelium dendriticum]|nr:unnamed protein product [Dicrocoelium dendriticum]
MYTQEQGLAMGSPISPVLANMYMEEFEKKALPNFRGALKVWWRYVDDTFAIIKRDKKEEFLNYLNSIDNAIKFTMELESQSGTLPFLDCLVHRKEGTLKTTMYRKPMDTDGVLSYSSSHPKHVYAGIASSLFHRASALCTEEEDKKAAQREAMKNLIASGYPKRLVKRQLQKCLNPRATPTAEWIATVGIPYKEGTSEAIRRVLNKEKIRVVFQKGRTLRSTLVHLKDTLPLDRTTNCIYKIPCKDCTQVYIGQTARELRTRISEHRRHISRPPRNELEYGALLRDSAIAMHALDTGHKIDFENVEVIRRGLRSAKQRLIAEAIEITKANNCVNRIDGVGLSSAWRPVLLRPAL